MTLTGISLLLLGQALGTEIVVRPGEPIGAALAKLPTRITLWHGDHIITAPLVLGPKQNGLTIAAKPGARLLGGVLLRKWQPLRDPAIASRLSAEARAHVLTADLPFAPAALASRGFSRPTTPAHTELFLDGRRMTLARWPNAGEFARIGATADRNPPDDGHGKPLGRLEQGFLYGGDRPSKWKSADGVWVHGYWAWDWAESYERISLLDTGRHLILTAPPHGLYGFREGQRYCFLNVLEELDTPGEYFIDAAARKVYFWPPGPLAGKEVAVSSLEQPFLEIKDASGITIDGLAFQYARGNGIVVENSSGIRLTGLELGAIGNNGVVVRGGQRVTVEHSHIAHTGDGGVELTGGDRATLTAANHAVTDNHLHDFGEWSKTYNPAIKINGVGNLLAHNNIHDAPHAGILLTGNDHVIEYNELHHLAKETGDVGAFYLGRDWTERGNVVRYNYIHHMGGVGSIGSMAVYLDDCASGTAVFGNIFYKVMRAAFVGGGRDNSVENNLFVECSTAVHVDTRGLNPRPVWHDMVYVTMKERLDAMHPHQPPYGTRYPKLAELDAYYTRGDGVPPEGTRIRRNIVFGPGSSDGKWLGLRERAAGFVKDIGDNWAEDKIGVANAAEGDFTLLEPEKARRIGFEPIRWREIGPRKRSVR